MADKYTIFDYFFDVIKGDMPGPFAMREVPDDKGAAAEYLIRYVLENTPATTGNPLYSNLIVPNPESKVETTEVDVLLLAREGIYVFESKNYSGWLFGSSDQQKWTERFPNGHKEYFYNPIMQNRTHVEALASHLGLPESTFHSFIVFSGNCELKAVPESTDEYVICRRKELRKLIKRDFGTRGETFTREEFGKLKEKFDRLAAASTEEAREGHIEQMKTVQRTCPYCGKELVERHRKSDGGTFIGCSGYPDCNYIRNSW